MVSEKFNWIIERLMNDIAEELSLRGHDVAIGSYQDYDGQDIVLGSRYLLAKPISQAKLNCLFVTHVDDRYKESELKGISKQFDLLLAMSEHDAAIVKKIVGTSSQVAGIDLPFRGRRLPSLTIAAFTAVYADGRKNEQWLINYAQKLMHADLRAIEFLLIGEGWHRVSEQLEKLGASTRTISLRRDAPGEYDQCLAELESADVLVYPGFDGGAMSVYDALSVGLRVIASNISYHRGLGRRVQLFNNEAEFMKLLDEHRLENEQVIAMLDARRTINYVNKLEETWTALMVGKGHVPEHERMILPPIQEVRRQYKGRSILRSFQAASRRLRRRLL